MTSSIQLGAELRLCWWRAPGDRGDDLVAVETPVLDEDLVRVVAGDDHAGNEDPWHRRLERFRIVFRNPGLWVDRNALRLEEIRVRSEAGHQVHTRRWESLLIDA